MKKRTIVLTVLGLMMATTSLVHAEDYPSIPVLVQGQTLGQALVIQGRAMVSTRDLENLGANVAWNNATKAVTVKFYDKQVTLSEVNQDITIVRKTGYKTRPAETIYAKLRSLEALGMSLDYQPKANRIVIKTSIPSSSTNTEISHEFVREALPPAYPNPVPDYRDDVRAGRVEISVDQAVDNYVSKYLHDGTLPLLRIKAPYIDLYKGNWEQEPTTREIMMEFARVLRLSPNSDERNIPLDLRNKKGSPDYILWAKFGKTPMFKDLIKSDGTIGNQMDAPMNALLLTKTVYLYYTEYMGVDLTQMQEFNRYTSPIHPGDMQKLSPEYAKMVSELRHIGIVCEYVSRPNYLDPYRINFGNVNVLTMDRLMCDILMGFTD